MFPLHFISILALRLWFYVLAKRLLEGYAWCDYISRVTTFRFYVITALDMIWYVLFMMYPRTWTDWSRCSKLNFPLLSTSNIAMLINYYEIINIAFVGFCWEFILYFMKFAMLYLAMLYANNTLICFAATYAAFKIYVCNWLARLRSRKLR